MTRSTRERLFIVGCGSRPYREYALATLAGRVELVLVQNEVADWQRPYADRCLAVPVNDVDALTSAIALELPENCPAGILTWDETALGSTAAVARRLGLRHMSPAAVRHCRDKLATRRALDRAGVPSARFFEARTREQALAAALDIGLPVVVKPRTLAGSLGITMANGPHDIETAFRTATGTAFPGLPDSDSVIVEELLDGPEVSVDCAVVDGHVTVCSVARKQLGFAPCFEEVGHHVVPWRDEPWASALVDVVRRAHAALGVDIGVTHTEVRLTSTGPRIVEVNGRLGGDLLPYLGRLATGVDLVRAAAEIALGKQPDLTPAHDGCAAVRFLYPRHDGRVVAVDVDDHGLPHWVDRIVRLACPGDVLRLPPRALTPRYAAVVVTGGESERACRERLDIASSFVTCRLGPLSEAPQAETVDQPALGRR